MTISTTETIISQLQKGRIIILVDDEHRENEGDLLQLAEFVTPDSINFMTKYGRGLVCLTLTQERCEFLQLPQMVRRNLATLQTAFTISIEAAQGVTTGISTADRAHTVKVAIDPKSKASDLVRPGHIFPLQAVEGGVLMRAGHTEAGCDLAVLAHKFPAAVICEIMNEDGTMARLPDLLKFAEYHDLSVGTIADLIEYRSRNESLIQFLGQKLLLTEYGEFELRIYEDLPSKNIHLALVLGKPEKHKTTLVRVHEPYSALDFIDLANFVHSWSLHACMVKMAKHGTGVTVILNCLQDRNTLLTNLLNIRSESAIQHESPEVRTFGVGAQILKDCGVQKMDLLGAPKRYPSMMGYGLEVISHIIDN